ncbi:MAG: AAA family ATPase [Promethearchaeota archaeon]
MKICHISLRNFRNFKEFQTDLGKYNVFVGQNNTGKSNLLWAIFCFYHPNELTKDDITKDDYGNLISNELEIILTFDDLTEKEQKNNNKYYFDDKIKISLKSFIDENGKFQKEHHGIIRKEVPEFPEDFDEDLKKVLESEKVPNISEIKKFDDLFNIKNEIQPTGRINKDNWLEIKKKFLKRHKDIKMNQIEVLSPEKYQGFIKTYRPEIIGSCILIPALNNPSITFDTSKQKTPINELISFFLQDIESEDIVEKFNSLQENIFDDREQKIKELEERFQEELKEWKTTINIKLKELEITESFPIIFDIFFNDGFLTDFERKGTGLQRYIFFKFLKISYEIRSNNQTSLILLFEEPEAHLHPQFQREIALILEKLSREKQLNYQIFITTHSPQFIDIENLDDIFIFSKENSGYSNFNKCNLNNVDLKEKIKTMLFFDPHINEIFFAERIIIIEGQTEEIILNLLIKQGDLDVSNISIINVKSKYNILTFLKIINQLKIPYSILIDEDPYFLPYFNKMNPNKLKEKKKAYKKTKEIAEQIDEIIGYLIIVSPDFDNFLGITQNQIKKYGKPLVAYKKFLELKNNKSNKLLEIKNLFNYLINPEKLLKHNIVDQNGVKWIFKTENSVKISTPCIDDLKKALQQVINQYQNIILNLSENEKEDLINLINIQQKGKCNKLNQNNSKKNSEKKNQNIISLDKWLKKKEEN